MGSVCSKDICVQSLESVLTSPWVSRGPACVRTWLSTPLPNYLCS